MMKEIVKKENVFGGEGVVLFEYLLDEKQLNNMCRLYAKVTLMPGSSLGYHVHNGESETYYILSGTGTYLNTNKEEIEVMPGDVTFTASGEGHAIKNNGKVSLELMALIIYDEKRIKS